MVRRVLGIAGSIACACGAASCATPSAIGTALAANAATAAISNALANMPATPSQPVVATNQKNQVIDTSAATIVQQNGQTYILMKPPPARNNY